MNTSRALLEKRHGARREPFPLAVIYKQINELETPVLRQGFDEYLFFKPV
ncbi:MAG: hypothetical protein OEM28_01825 [Nitrosopumilus sp.]|nr:hypothetical protein [Nitrosopumilus sp.]MDH3487816.1 hypothetical protein [Nitrosopumilus sp.]